MERLFGQVWEVKVCWSGGKKVPLREGLKYYKKYLSDSFHLVL